MAKSYREHKDKRRQMLRRKFNVVGEFIEYLKKKSFAVPRPGWGPKIRLGPGKSANTLVAVMEIRKSRIRSK